MADSGQQNNQAVDHSSEESPVTSKLKTNFLWTASLVIDNLFLAIWLLAQWGVSKLAEQFPAHGVDYYAIIVVQVLFAVSTLAPIVFWICKDIAIMYYRTKMDIKNVKLLSEGEQTGFIVSSFEREKEKDKV